MTSCRFSERAVCIYRILARVSRGRHDQLPSLDATLATRQGAPHATGHARHVLLASADHRVASYRLCYVRVSILVFRLYCSGFTLVSGVVL